MQLNLANFTIYSNDDVGNDQKLCNAQLVGIQHSVSLKTAVNFLVNSVFRNVAKFSYMQLNLANFTIQAHEDIGNDQKLCNTQLVVIQRLVSITTTVNVLVNSVFKNVAKFSYMQLNLANFTIQAHRLSGIIRNCAILNQQVFSAQIQLKPQFTFQLTVIKKMQLNLATCS